MDAYYSARRRAAARSRALMAARRCPTNDPRPELVGEVKVDARKASRTGSAYLADLTIRGAVRIGAYEKVGDQIRMSPDYLEWYKRTQQHSAA